MINGNLINVGDRVYDKNNGYGRVIDVERDQSFTVSFSKTGNKRFSQGGHFGKERRIYWHDPMVVDPMKNKALWTAFCTITRVIYDLLNTLSTRFSIDETENKELDKKD